MYVCMGERERERERQPRGSIPVAGPRSHRSKGRSKPIVDTEEAARRGGEGSRRRRSRSRSPYERRGRRGRCECLNEGGRSRRRNLADVKRRWSFISLRTGKVARRYIFHRGPYGSVFAFIGNASRHPYHRAVPVGHSTLRHSTEPPPSSSSPPQPPPLPLPPNGFRPSHLFLFYPRTGIIHRRRRRRRSHGVLECCGSGGASGGASGGGRVLPSIAHP